LQKQQKWALASEAEKHINAMIALARSEPGIPICHSDLDANPWLLNCPNGTLDLQTGKLRPHCRDDLITKLCPTPYDENAECDLWVESLKTIFNQKIELVHYFQRLCGYSLTGIVREQILPIGWGTGSNGKSLVFDTVLSVLGSDYACVGARELLMRGRSE